MTTPLDMLLVGMGVIIGSCLVAFLVSELIFPGRLEHPKPEEDDPALD